MLSGLECLEINNMSTNYSIYCANPRQLKFVCEFLDAIQLPKAVVFDVKWVMDTRSPIFVYFDDNLGRTGYNYAQNYTPGEGDYTISMRSEPHIFIDCNQLITDICFEARCSLDEFESILTGEDND